MGATSNRGDRLSCLDHLPNSLDLLVLLGQTTLGVVAVLVEVGGQTLSTLFLGLATL